MMKHFHHALRQKLIQYMRQKCIIYIYLNVHSHIEATTFSNGRAHYRALQRLKRKGVKMSFITAHKHIVVALWSRLLTSKSPFHLSRPLRRTCRASSITKSQVHALYVSISILCYVILLLYYISEENMYFLLHYMWQV